jgi:hypothetical protein
MKRRVINALSSDIFGLAWFFPSIITTIMHFQADDVNLVSVHQATYSPRQWRRNDDGALMRLLV